MGSYWAQLGKWVLTGLNWDENIDPVGNKVPYYFKHGIINLSSTPASGVWSGGNRRRVSGDMGAGEIIYIDTARIGPTRRGLLHSLGISSP